MLLLIFEIKFRYIHSIIGLLSTLSEFGSDNQPQSTNKLLLTIAKSAGSRIACRLNASLIESNYLGKIMKRHNRPPEAYNPSNG